MRPPVLLAAALLACAFPLPAGAAGYALHGTFVDYGSATGSNGEGARRIPAVLYVAIHGREARLHLSAPGARCVPGFGDSHYLGQARDGGPDTLAVHLDQKSDCVHVSNDARLFLRFTRELPRGVAEAVLTDHVKGVGGPVLFEAN